MDRCEGEGYSCYFISFVAHEVNTVNCYLGNFLYLPFGNQDVWVCAASNLSPLKEGMTSDEPTDADLEVEYQGEVAGCQGHQYQGHDRDMGLLEMFPEELEMECTRCKWWGGW